MTGASSAAAAAAATSVSSYPAARRGGFHDDLNLPGLCLVVVTPMLGGLLCGFDIGATSFVLSMLLLLGDDKATMPNVWWSTGITSVQQGLLISAVTWY